MSHARRLSRVAVPLVGLSSAAAAVTFQRAGHSCPAVGQTLLAGCVAITAKLRTGCSSGIGKATSVRARVGWLRPRARRSPRGEAARAQVGLKACAGSCCHAHPGSVTSDAFYETLKAKDVPKKVDILVANAGLAVGKEIIGAADDNDWEQMMSANCMGTFRLINLCLPAMVAKGGVHIVATGSIAGMESYEGGSVYCGQNSLHAFMKSLRYETFSKNIRVTVVGAFSWWARAPSLVRCASRATRARRSAYTGVEELRASDCAAQILWAVRQPKHVNVDFLQLMPTCQGRRDAAAQAVGKSVVFAAIRVTREG